MDCPCLDIHFPTRWRLMRCQRQLTLITQPQFNILLLNWLDKSAAISCFWAFWVAIVGLSLRVREGQGELPCITPPGQKSLKCLICFCWQTHTHTEAHTLIAAMSLLALMICITHFSFTLLWISMNMFNYTLHVFKERDLSSTAAWTSESFCVAFLKNVRVVDTVVTKIVSDKQPRPNKRSELLLPADVMFFLSLGRQPGAELLSRVPLISWLIPPSITQRQLQRMGADTGAMGGTKVLLLVFLVGWEKSLGLNWNPVPRKTVRYQGEWETWYQLIEELGLRGRWYFLVTPDWKNSWNIFQHFHPELRCTVQLTNQTWSGATS